LNIEEIDLLDLPSHCSQASGQTKKHRFTLTIDSDVSQFIFADAVRLKQIIVNLIANALKFTEGIYTVN
jgi:signal transduction histidine kinase